jgi:hypothetical protein
LPRTRGWLTSSGPAPVEIDLPGKSAIANDIPTALIIPLARMLCEKCIDFCLDRRLQHLLGTQPDELVELAAKLLDRRQPHGRLAATFVRSLDRYNFRNLTHGAFLVPS